MTRDELHALIRRTAGKSLTAWAKAHNIYPTQLTNVLGRRRPPPDRLLDALGVESETIYRFKRTRVVSPSLTDLSAPGVIDDCRTEFDRCEREHYGYADWALKWARPLIAKAEQPTDEEMLETMWRCARMLREIGDVHVNISRAIELLEEGD